MASTEAAETHKRFHKSTILFGALVCAFGLIICGLGIWLVYLKSIGTTKFKLFGQELASDNVGVAAIFIGAVVIILALRRILKSMDKISDSYSKTISTLVNSKRGNKFIQK